MRARAIETVTRKNGFTYWVFWCGKTPIKICHMRVREESVHRARVEAKRAQEAKEP